MNPVALRCGVDWKQQRYRCGNPTCTRCRKRQMRRECRAVMDRLDALTCQFAPVTIRLGATDELKGAIAKTRADIRNRLNLCRQASGRWSDAAIWGWFRVVENGSGQLEVSAHAIVRIGRLLGQTDVYEAVIGTWDKPGQVEVGVAIGHDSLPVLARDVVARAFAHGCSFPGVSNFRSLRFRYGRAPASRLTACTNPMFYELMPVLF